MTQITTACDAVTAALFQNQNRRAEGPVFCHNGGQSCRATYIRRRSCMCRLFSIMAVLLCFCTVAVAKGNPERTQFGRDIYVQANETVGESTCFGCSIHIRGQVNGDVTTFGGSIVVEDGASITGDATSFGGGIRLQGVAAVSGDAATFGGYLRRDPQSRVGGDVTSFSGFGWLIGMVAIPLLFVAGFIALVVWLVRRNRAVTAAYASASTTRA